MNSLTIWFLGNPASPTLVGHIQKTVGNNFSFTYDDTWIRNGFSLSKELPLTSTPYFHDRTSKLHAIIDSMPDRWGEAMLGVLHNNQVTRTIDKLFYAGDDRFGALGFSSAQTEYVPCETNTLKSFVSIEELYNILDNVNTNDDISEHLKRLLSSTKSMGGAHPKALLKHDGSEYIIKFPFGSNIDTPRIEHATMTLAKKCGINAAETRLFPLGCESVVAVKRFDRTSDGGRIHALSLKAMMQNYGDDDYMTYSYKDIYDVSRQLNMQSGTHIPIGEEIFRRMIFNILMDNTDDHEKNHCFLYQGAAWELSPAYDVTPLASGIGSSELSIGEMGRDVSFENIITSHQWFGLSKEDAMHIMSDVITEVSNWKAHFESLNVTANDIEYLSIFIDPIINELSHDLHGAAMSMEMNGYPSP